MIDRGGEKDSLENGRYMFVGGDVSSGGDLYIRFVENGGV
jgi:hypothetical protein